MNYFVEANLGLVFLFGVYYFLIGKETDFSKQRAFLLLSMGCALLFPFIQISSETVPELMPTITLQDFVVDAQQSTTNAKPVDILLIVYVGIALVITMSLIMHAIKIYRVINGANGNYQSSYFIIESNENVPSWSFFKVIYIGRSKELTNEDRDLVVKHEMLHGKLYHSADMLFATLLCIVFWFNPFAWLYRRTLAKVHEYQVDAIVADQNTVGYTELLVKSALIGNNFLLTHHFNQSFILKRINMIATIKNRISSWKFAGLAMSLVIYFVSVSCSEVDQHEEFKQPEPYKGEVFQVVSDQPTPVGGFGAFSEELSTVLKYPKAAKEKGIQGTVFVEFVVRPDGAMSDFKVIKGLSEECDNAALVAISKVKKWNPGSHNGKPVAVRFVLPIKFKLD